MRASVAVRGARPAFAAACLVAVALGAVSGCSSSGSSSAPTATTTTGSSSPSSATPQPTPSATPTVSTAPTGSAAPTVAMTPVAAATGQLTGTQLASVLLPTSVFPSDFGSPTTGPITSGGSLTTGAATYDLTKITCATFIQHFGTTGFGETAMVTGSVAASGLGGAAQAFDELIYQFATPAGATAFVAGVRSLAARCGSFTATANGSKGKFALSAAPGSAVGGHPSLSLTQVGALGGEALTLDTLLSASGVDVFGATAVGVKTGAPAVPARETIVYKLMQRQSAAAVLS